MLYAATEMISNTQLQIKPGTLFRGPLKQRLKKNMSNPVWKVVLVYRDKLHNMLQYFTKGLERTEPQAWRNHLHMWVRTHNPGILKTQMVNYELRSGQHGWPSLFEPDLSPFNGWNSILSDFNPFSWFPAFLQAYASIASISALLVQHLHKLLRIPEPDIRDNRFSLGTQSQTSGLWSQIAIPSWDSKI